MSYYLRYLDVILNGAMWVAFGLCIGLICAHFYKKYFPD